MNLKLPEVRVELGENGMPLAVHVDGHRIPMASNVTVRYPVRGLPVVTIEVAGKHLAEIPNAILEIRAASVTIGEEPEGA